MYESEVMEEERCRPVEILVLKFACFGTQSILSEKVTGKMRF